MVIFFDWLENNVRKGENAGYQHFLLFPQCFQKLSVSLMLTDTLMLTVTVLKPSSVAFLGQCRSRSDCIEHAV